MSRERILRTLRGHAAARVNFTVRAYASTITVNRTTFERVASAIENGTVNLTIISEAEMPMLGAGAAYYAQAGVANNPTYFATRSPNIPANSLFTQETFGRIEESQLIHESVHASLDLTRSNGIISAFEEAACFIAEALYCRRMGLPRWRYYLDQIGSTALSIANSIISTGHADDAAVTRLVKAVATHSLYRANAAVCYTSDG